MANVSTLITGDHAQEVEPGFDHQIDARGLSCPLPMLSTRKSLELFRRGDVLKVLVTDKGSPSYFESFARQAGLELLTWSEYDGGFAFFLRKE